MVIYRLGRSVKHLLEIIFNTFKCVWIKLYNLQKYLSYIDHHTKMFGRVSNMAKTAFNTAYIALKFSYFFSILNRIKFKKMLTYQRNLSVNDIWPTPCIVQLPLKLFHSSKNVVLFSFTFFRSILFSILPRYANLLLYSGVIQIWICRCHLT